MTLADYEKDPNHITNDFIKYYYSKLSSDCSKLYQLYALDAVLKHMDHTSDPFKAVSTDYHDFENIKKYWKSLPCLSGAKLVILTVNTIQNSDNSLVINVVGELLLKEDYENDDEILPTKLFTQTFILQPHQSKDIYDIKSDILTFIPDTDYMNVELNGSSSHAGEDAEPTEDAGTQASERIVESKEQVQQEVVEPTHTSKINNKVSSTANGLTSESKKIVKNSIPSSSSSNLSSLTNNTTEPKKTPQTSQPPTASSSSLSDSPSASTAATSAITTTAKITESNKPNGAVSSSTTSSEPGKKDLSNNATKTSTQNTPAENKQNLTSSTDKTTSTIASSSTSINSATTKSDKASSETSASPKLHPASPAPSSSTPPVKPKASASQEAKQTPAPQPTPSASSTWASALKITNKPASPLLSQSQTLAQQSHSQSSPKSGSTLLTPSSTSSPSATPSTSNSTPSGTSNQFNKQLHEVYVNFKNSAVPVDEADLKSAFSSNKFKHFTIVTINKNNTAIVGFSSQEEQARALALGKIVQGETQFGIDKREKKINGKKRSNTYKNSNKRN